MMRIVTLVILYSCVTEAHAVDLDETTLAKTHPGVGGGPLTRTVARPASRVAAPGCASSVRAMQNTLRRYGVESSPMEKLALTGLASTRDVCMAAQVNQVTQSMDAKSQTAVMATVSEVQEKAKKMAGVTAPLGFFDPFGISADLDYTEADLVYYRELELKHGRVAMLATLGLVMGEVFSPIFGGPDVPAAYSWASTTNDMFWPAVLIASAAHEIAALRVTKPDGTNGLRQFTADGLIGDYDWDPLNLKPKDPKALRAMQDKEINNGRLAMFASAGIIGQELATGTKIFR